MRRITHLLTLLITVSLTNLLISQGTAINESGNPPDNSAMLDVESTTRGVLVPRMTTAQREGIASPAAGLLVFDNSTASFWYNTSGGWIELTDNWHGLRDADHDTQVQVEESPDEDIIRFDIGGTEVMVLDESSQGATRLSISPDNSLIVGHLAGTKTQPGRNTFLGYSAGEFNTDGSHNIFVGFETGRNNGLGASHNVIMGNFAGMNNEADNNTMVGHQTGTNNTAGYNNTFLGYIAGFKNRGGFRNTFLGSHAGHDNEIGNENTFVGFNAGIYNLGKSNTFLGANAGRVNRSGNSNTIVGAEAAGNDMSNRNLGDGNAIFGTQAAFQTDSIWQNTLMGYHVAYNMANGGSNVLLGYQAGYLSSANHANVGVGIDVLYENRSGSHNVAVGDSALMNNLVSGNVALGSKAGLDNTEGSGNTFLGYQAGESNTIADLNTFVGWRSGNYNTTGGYNVAVGSETANANSSGSGNTFIGYAAGFRNSEGNENVFAGQSAGEFNTDGSTNIGIGLWACTQNATGHNNIAIGEYALGNFAGGEARIERNIAIGLEAGRDATGNQNIIIGNLSGISVDGNNNVMLGHNIDPLGNHNTFIGSETSATWIEVPFNATAIGYGATISQNYSIILGDYTENQVKVGVGVLNPEAKVHIDNNDFQEIFRAANNGVHAFRILDNRDVIVNKRLLVNTTAGKLGYEVSVDGEIACEEVLVELSDNWPDYVFSEEYKLMSFRDLQSFIEFNGHLPGVPSAVVVERDGLQLGAMQKVMLEKIEELTLYILDLENRLQMLENE